MQEDVVGRHLARLGDEDSEGRRAAMHSLKAFVEKLDSGSMPAFLQQVSPSRATDMASPQTRSFAISLYEEVAKAHGKMIVPHIGRVMATVTRSLASGTCSSPQLHQACARVVAALARHAIDPAAPVAEGEAILRNLCQPLWEALSAESEPLAAGAALCLQALVESEKWKLADTGIVQGLCSRVSAELRGRGGNRLPQLQLARSLVMTCGPAVGTHAGAFLRAASHILLTSPRDGTWHARVGAARLVHAVFWRLDHRRLPAEEVAAAVEALKICSHDLSPQVRSAALEAIESAALRFTEDNDSTRQVSLKKTAAEWTGKIREPRSSSPESPPQPSLLSREHCSDDPWCAERRRREAMAAESGLDSIWMKVDMAEDAFTEPAFEYDDLRLSNVSENLSAEGSPMRLVGLGTGGNESCVDYMQEESTSSVVSMITTEVPTNLTPSSTVTVEPQQQRQSCTFHEAADLYAPLTTPRRLLRSLVVDLDSGSKGLQTPQGDGTHLDMETCSNSSWSVRYNPIANEEALHTEEEEEEAAEHRREGTDCSASERSCAPIVEDARASSAPALEEDFTSSVQTVTENQIFRSAQCEGLNSQGQEVLNATSHDGKRLTGPAIRHKWLPSSSVRAARGLAEMLLGGSFCAMVALPVAIAISKVLESHSHTAGLVPT